MALHPRADEGHLAEVVACAPADAERVKYPCSVVLVLDGCGEHDLRPGLHDRVDVHACPGEGREEPRRRDAVDPVDRLLSLVDDAGDERFLEHLLVLFSNPRARRIGERRTNVELHIVVARDLDRARGNHARS